jgi:hypothetical protein
MKMPEYEYLFDYLKLLVHNINGFFAGKTKLVIEVEENKHHYPKTTTKIYLEEKE